MDIISLVTGVTIGAIIGYIVIYFTIRSKTVSKTTFESLTLKYNDAVTESKLHEDRYRLLQRQAEVQDGKLAGKEQDVVQLQAKAVALQANFANMEARASELAINLEKMNLLHDTRQSEVIGHKQEIAELNAGLRSKTESLASYQESHEKQKQLIDGLNSRVNELTAQTTKLTANNDTLSEKLDTQKKDMEEMHNRAHFQFERIANQIFEEKSLKFTASNKATIETLLNPLKDDIGKFKVKVEETYDKESKQRFSLEEKVKELIEQTNKVSNEANKLATALKGQTKKQGDWGEMILERILETSGLTKDREYFVQQTFKADDGKNLRPDILVKLPDERVIIIDSKVSLNAYEKFSSAENGDEQRFHLADHLRCLYAHIDDLSGKKYDNLENSLDFTMMFIPIEPGYMIAIQSDEDMWAYAYSKRVLLISPTNLIACLKLISDLWNREKQSKNAMAIVKRGELLYEKFVTFAVSLEDIGKHIGKAQAAYQAATDQLKSGKGNLVGQAIQLKSMGLKSNKRMPAALLPVEVEEQEDEGGKNDDDATPLNTNPLNEAS